MRCQVVLSGFDSRESVTIQQDLHFPIVLPNRDSYGATIVDGLANNPMLGGKWHDILDVHSDDTYTKSFVSGESDAEIVLSDAGTEVHQFIFIDASIGITEAEALATLLATISAQPCEAELDISANGINKSFATVSNTLEIVLCSPTATIRYMCRLYEHDDKTVGEMDNIALHDLSFVEIDD